MLTLMSASNVAAAMDFGVTLTPDDDHWIMLANGKAVARDVRGFIDDPAFPKESVFRPAAK